jgi:hypothetical protein
MLEDVCYWDISSWKDFVRETLVPLRDLALFLSQNLTIDPLGQEAERIGYLARQAVDIAEKIFNESMGTFSTGEDIFEVARDFMEKVANFTATCSKHTFFVWSTRKITKYYLEEHYTQLKESEKFKEVSKVLGLTEYWSPPSVKSKLVEAYQVYAYPDYLTLFDIVQEDVSRFRFRVSNQPDSKRTLGGLICELNELSWRILTEKPGIVAGYEIRPPVLESYRATCEKMLNEALWKDEKNFIVAKPFNQVETDPNFSILYEFEGLAVKRMVRYGNYETQSKTSIFEFWDTLMPPMFLGKYEFVLDAGKKKGIILSRW